jgi:membrane protein implicated in regulation of membrane protease activity
VFAAVQGLGALVGGVVAGALLGDIGLLVVVIAILQVLALLLLWRTTRGQEPTPTRRPPA